MSIELQYNLVVIVGLLIVVASLIIPRIIKKKTITTHATNATNADIVNAIHSLKDSLKDTIYIAAFATMGIQICVILAVMTVLISKK